MENEILSTKHFFESHHIILSDEWLESCIQWYREENPNLNYTRETLHLKVYEQWLLLDLRDVEVPVLPPNLSRQKKTILNGNFSLQMMQVTDIARPKLLQIQKLRNQNFLNRTTLDYENEANSYGKRMLQLILTDGVQEIEAIEYKPVKALHVNMSPGIKIKIVGPITVRRGQLMLKEENVVILGGEVEEILVPNAAENILARALNLPQNPNPNIIEESSEDVNATNTSRNNLSNAYNTIQNNSNHNNPIRNNNVDQRRHVDNVINLRNTYQPSTSNANSNAITEDEEALILRQVDELLEAERDLAESESRPTISKPSVFESSNPNIPQGDDLDASIFGNMDIDAELDLIDEQNKLKERNDGNLVLISQLKTMSKDELSSKTFTINAKFKSVIQKLTVADNAWSLKLLIEDTSDDLEVFVHSDIISNLIGYNPSAMLALKKDILSKNESATATVMKAIEGLKEKIMELNCFMKIQFAPNKDYATVINLNDAQ